MNWINAVVLAISIFAAALSYNWASDAKEYMTKNNEVLEKTGFMFKKMSKEADKALSISTYQDRLNIIKQYQELEGEERVFAVKDDNFIYVGYIHDLQTYTVENFKLYYILPLYEKQHKKIAR